AVALVFVDNHVAWQVSSFWALVLAEVKNGLFFTTAKCNLLRVQVVGDTPRVRVLVCHCCISPLLRISNGTPNILCYLSCSQQLVPPEINRFAQILWNNWL